jgi:hypothetical protein
MVTMMTMMLMMLRRIWLPLFVARLLTTAAAGALLLLWVFDL